MKFGEIDKKLLVYLYHNSRKSLNQIAKACRISRDQVEYRMKKFEGEGLIKKYLTVYNYGLLGLDEFVVVWFRLKKGRKEIKDKLSRMKNVVSVGEVVNKYDLFVNFLFKDKALFDLEFNKFLEKYGDFIEGYDVFFSNFIEIYPLKSFGKNSNEINYSIVDSKDVSKVSDKDFKILRELDRDGRMKIIDIAENVEMSSELVLYRMKKLLRDKVILGTRIAFDMEKMGFYFAGLQLEFKNLSEKVKGDLKKFCKLHKNVNALSFGFGRYNCFVQFFYEREEELRNGVRDLRKVFEGVISNSELILIEKESGIRMLPLE